MSLESNEFIFDFKDLNDKAKLNDKVLLGIKYLSNLKEPNDLFEDQIAFDAYFYIGKSVAYGNKVIDRTNFCKHNFPSFLGKLLMHIYNINKDLEFKDEINDMFNACKSQDLNEKRVYVLSYSLYILNINAMNYVNFSSSFSSSVGLNAHFAFISDEEFIQKHINSMIWIWERKISLIEYFVMNISSLSKLCSDNQEKWNNLNSVNSLLNIKNKKPSCELDACIAITNIADDKQIENLTEIHSVIELLNNQINKAAQDFVQNQLNRQSRQVFENSIAKNCLVHCIFQENKTTTSILVLLQALYRLSVNDRMKIEIYFGKNIKEPLKIFLEKGNEYEIKYSLRLLAQLSFNKDVSKDVFNNQEFKKILSSIASTYQGELVGENDFSIKNLCKQIDWNLKEIEDEIKNLNKNSEHKSNESELKHVMISYNTASRDLCLKIKERLESFGHKIWIDVNDIHGSSLDAMANAVENSYCVLICITEKYRSSINCQAEAQYAFRINKPIIPLIMEAGYENVKGWLGIIMGDKIFINFKKYDFEECIRRLKKEVDSSYTFLNNKSILSNNPSENRNTNIKNWPSNQTSRSAIENWNEKMVNEWFEKNNLNLKITESLKPCNGIMLTQLYEMKNEAPEFFYQSLKSDAINLNSLLLFTFQLKKLFNS